MQAILIELGLVLTSPIYHLSPCILVASDLSFQSMAELRETMIFPLLCMSIKRGDLEAIDKICSKFVSS